MQPTSRKIACPVCGRMIDLVPKTDNPLRVEGYCGHGTGNVLPVIETDYDIDLNYLQKLVSPDKAKKDK